jgi:hypothetical protein
MHRKRINTPATPKVMTRVYSATDESVMLGNKFPKIKKSTESTEDADIKATS